MNMTLKYRRFVLAIVWLVLNLGLGLQLSEAATPVADKLGVSREILTDRIENLSTEIDIEYTSLTEKAIIRYTVTGKVASEKMLGRVNLYYPVIENELIAKGLPEIIKYIPIIESALRPDARSRVGAVGLWQFMKPTARMKNLVINRTIDERNDPVKSTYAALDYLSELHEQFGDWTLAIAAYNCGPGNVRKAIRKSGSYNYWKLRRFLPKETRQYIPKLIAAAYLMKYYHYHDLVPELAHDDFMYVSTATVYQKVDLKKLSTELDLDFQVINQLNSEYIKKYIPKSTDGYALDLPSDKLHAFYEIYQPHEIEKIQKIALDKKIVFEEKRKKKLTIEKLQTKALPARLLSMEDISVLHQKVLASL